MTIIVRNTLTNYNEDTNGSAALKAINCADDKSETPKSIIVIEVSSYWQGEGFVNIDVGNTRITVQANDLMTAIDNATNTARDEDGVI